MNLTPKEISEGSEILAKFMDLKPRQIVGYDSNGNRLTLDGYDYEIDGYEFIRPNEYVSKSFQSSSEVIYHKVIPPYNMRYIYSWDWMFPIIDKINGLGKGYNFATFKTYISCVVEKGGNITKNYHFANSENITPTQTGKEATFKLLVKFVKWHNEFIKEEIEK